MDLEKVEALLELMQRYGCIQAVVGDVSLTCDPTAARPVADGSLAEKKEEIQVSGDPKRTSRLNPLLRHPKLGLGPLIETDAGEKTVAP